MCPNKISPLALSGMLIATWLLGASGAVNAADTVVVRGCLSLDGEFRKISDENTCRSEEVEVTRFHVTGKVPRGESGTFPVADRFEILLNCNLSSNLSPSVFVESFGTSFGNAISPTAGPFLSETLFEGDFFVNTPLAIITMDDHHFVAFEDVDESFRSERWSFVNGSTGYAEFEPSECFVDIEGEIRAIALDP